MRIFCDFDGTISTVDTTDLVLSRLAPPAWREIEDEWIAGRIDAARCMRDQIGLLTASDAALDVVLDEVEIDPSFGVFAAWCERQSIPLVVLSDGVERFIQRIMARNGLGHLPVYANRASPESGWRLSQPWADRHCSAGQGVCKCALALGPHERRGTVFIGDGRSDFCLGMEADMVFAKSKLAEHLAANGAPFFTFHSFHDIAAVLSRKDAQAPQLVTATL